jgi:hypothetical protein
MEMLEEEAGDPPSASWSRLSCPKEVEGEVEVEVVVVCVSGEGEQGGTSTHGRVPSCPAEEKEKSSSLHLLVFAFACIHSHNITQHARRRCKPIPLILNAGINEEWGEIRVVS